jgi:hypothetical protein
MRYWQSVCSTATAYRLPIAHRLRRMASWLTYYRPSRTITSHNIAEDASPASQTDEHPDENEVKDLTRLQEEHFLALFWQTYCRTAYRLPIAHRLRRMASWLTYYRPSRTITSADNQQGDLESGWQARNANLVSRTYYQRAQRLLQ